MLAYVVKRLLGVIPVTATVVTFVFLLLRLSPGDPAVLLAGEAATEADIARVRAALGLDRSLWDQFTIWIGQLLQGDLGHSVLSNISVTDLIAQRIEPTISLAITTMIFSLAISVPLGVFAASRAGTITDRAVMTGSVMAFSFPVFFTGYLLVWLFAIQLRWLPVQGFTPIRQGLGPFLANIALPTVTLGLAYMALLTRMSRSAMLEVLRQDYIRTARAKGLPVRTVLFVHALKNASVPIVTTAGVGVALLIGGTVITESVFSIPGLGRLTVDAILSHDYPVIQGLILFFSIIYVLMNLAIDLSYCLLDPRIRY
jgi:peptide/nickel transport system permease protein